MGVTKVTVSIRGPWVGDAGNAVRRGLLTSGHPAIEAMFLRWAGRYREFSLERYRIQARGGGEWPDLSASTIHARAMRLSRKERNKHGGKERTLQGYIGAGLRHHPAQKIMVGGRWTLKAHQQYDSAVTNAEILIDRGVLIHALDISAPGNVTRREGPSIVFGFGGPDAYPGGHATIAQIAAAHQTGGRHGRGVLPQRRILVPPPESVIDGMLGDARKAITAIFGG